MQLEGENVEPGSDAADETRWIIARTREEAEKQAQAKYGDKKYTLKQDEDVLDTWFSSALWPFSTVGWPEKVSYFHAPVRRLL